MFLGELHPCLALTISKALGQNLTEKLRYYTGKIAEYLFAEEADAATNQMVSCAAQAAFRD